MKITVEKPKLARKSMTLKAKTPDELVDELNSKWPGHFDAKLHADIKMKSDHSVVSLKLYAEGYLTLPKWANLGKQGKKTKAEWKRFLSKVTVHERGHELILLESMAIIADKAQRWYDDEVAAGRTPTGEALDALYDDVWYPKYSDPPQDTYDDKTKHGKTQGAWFDAGNCD